MPLLRPVATCALTTLTLFAAAGCTADRTSVVRHDSGRAGVPDSTPATTRVDLTGAGATFPYPLYARWFNTYADDRGVRINYRSIGSVAGIEQLEARTVDFGATDVFLSDAELKAAPFPILHVPTAIGAVALTYNLPGLVRPLRLSGAVIADIFLGRLTRWNDARIVALNPTATLPGAPIQVVHRADASGTSYILSDYLAAVSPAWAAGPGRGRNVRWPVGAAGNGNEGVAASVKETIGAVGYVEVMYARQNRLPVAHVQNRTGRFVSPMPYEVASAATAVLDGLPLDPPSAASASDLRVSLVNAPGPQSYPIASFTWLLLAPQVLGAAKTGQLVDFLRWALLDAVDLTSTMGYVPLPTAAAERVVDRLERLAPSRE